MRFSKLTRIAAALSALSLSSLVFSQPAVAAGSISGKTIVVDPGHGGKDPGAVDNGVQEKSVTLAVGQQLGAILQAQGARVLMTRTGDANPAPAGTVDDDLRSRVNLAQQAHASAFVSIHGNEAADSSVSGTTTFYGPICGFYSGVKLSQADVGRSYSLAQKVQSAIVSRTHERDKGTQSAAFWVLGNPGIPAILVETAFLSNKGDAARLTDPGYQRVLADAIADGLTAFFGSGDDTGTPPAPRDGLDGCPGVAPKDDRAGAKPAAERWVQTVLSAPLLSGADDKAKVFATLPPFTYLKVLGQSGDFLNVLNPATNGPGYIEAKKVGPSGPPPSPPAFEPFWVQSFRPTQLWSGVSGGVTFGPLPVWSYLQVLTPSTAARLYVRIAATGSVAYVDRADVGPSGPPPSDEPAPSASPPAAAPPRAAPAVSKPTSTIVVVAGDTVSGIATREGVGVSDLISVNHLSADGRLTVGQKLVLPASSASPAAARSPGSGPASVTVGPGETLTALAGRLGVPVQTLVDLNHLTSPDDLQAGQSLRVA